MKLYEMYKSYKQLELKAEKVSVLLFVLTVCVWVLFGVSWIMSYEDSLAYIFPASHFWWILLAGILIHSFWRGYDKKSCGTTIKKDGEWVKVSAPQKSLIFNGVKNVFMALCVTAFIVGCLALYGHTIGFEEEGCVASVANNSTGWQDVCVEYESDYQKEPYSGYDDGIDQDCADIGYTVYVDGYDPDGLDGDGDGYGCE